MRETKGLPFGLLDGEPREQGPQEAKTVLRSVDDRYDSPIRVSFDETTDFIWFSASGPSPASVEPHHPGDWIEGLWENDVAEFFVSRPDLGRYLEFNLSPTAAWWHCRFTGPRERDPVSCTAPDAFCLANVSSEKGSGRLWRAALGIEKTWLVNEIGPLDEGLWNANSIFHGGDLPMYASWTPLGEPQPDFHRPQDFVRREFGTQ